MNSRASRAKGVTVAETRTGETRTGAFERLVVALRELNDIRESQRPPPLDEDAPPVSLPEEPRLSQH